MSAPRTAGWGGRSLPLLGIGLTLVLGGVVLRLALSPPYAWTQETWAFSPSTPLTVLRSYLFRNAVANTAWLVLGTTPAVLLLAALWARAGLPSRGRVLLLAPLFLPGAVAGMLWRPLLEPWLVLAQAELALLCTGLVIMWLATPPAAWLVAHGRRRAAALLPVWYALTEAGLVLTLTRGEPFNASHTWPSWLLTNLWVMRAWGLAAVMSIGLAVTVAALLVAGLWRVRDYGDGPSPRVNRRGTTVALFWIGVPFVFAPLPVVAAPSAAWQGLLAAGLLPWIINWGLVIGATAGISWLIARRAMRVALPRWMPAAVVVQWLLWPVALAWFGYQAAWLRSPLVLVVPSAVAAGLLLRWFAPGRVSLRLALGLAALLLAHAFALEAALGFTPAQALPTLGAVMMTGEGDPARRGLALLLHGGLALAGAWMLSKDNGPLP